MRVGRLVFSPEPDKLLKGLGNLVDAGAGEAAEWVVSGVIPKANSFWICCSGGL